MSWSLKFIDEARSFERWGVLKQEIITLEEFEKRDGLKSGIYSIYANGALVDINIDIVESLPLIVFFNGAQKRTPEVTLPVFSGLNVTPKGMTSRLSINDPSLYMGDDMLMSWYAGSRFVPLQKEIIPRIISKVVQSIDASRLIFSGGSAGGFASLYYSKHFKDAICITSNPQTSISTKRVLEQAHI
ncbi:hypothetical protein [Zobellella iuensis]|uniref:Uncharacterized protein n=1 Tax=Zobellella iuensis TaxID=2803811 RepID=A0ABS1QSL2_9GAMM|nr:hypothetical protein [Zobellella iuensis]MBL1377766.1 hypothetical protein [Zobellella iuensis]